LVILAIIMSDTIFALSSGQGRAGIAIIRLSGAKVGMAFRKLCGRVPEARRASVMTVRDPQDGGVIDKGICLFFSAPKSFTGEDMGELQLHGGRAVVAAALSALGSLPAVSSIGEVSSYPRWRGSRPRSTSRMKAMWVM